MAKKLKKKTVRSKPAKKKPARKKSSTPSRKTAAKAAKKPAPIKKAAKKKELVSVKVQPVKVKVKEIKKQQPLTAKPQNVITPLSKPERKPKEKKIKRVYMPYSPFEVKDVPEKPPVSSLPEPAGKFTLEYIFNCSPDLLYHYMSSPDALRDWFADSVHYKDGIFYFQWDKTEQRAQMISRKEPEHVRFSWLDRPGYYFELRLNRDDLTNETAMLVTDFTDDNDFEGAKLVWDNQVGRLRSVIASF